jgi:cytoskeletal protein CcmA (bactofilin family)
MKKEIKIPSNTDTRIAKSSVLNGDLEVTGTLLIEGRIEGSIKSHDNIYIGKTAVVKGDITAKNTYIFGVVQGNITTDGFLYLSASSKLFGNVKANSFNVEKGSVYRGLFETTEHNESKEISSDDEEPKRESVIESL